MISASNEMRQQAHRLDKKANASLCEGRGIIASQIVPPRPRQPLRHRTSLSQSRLSEGRGNIRLEIGMSWLPTQHRSEWKAGR